MSTMKVIKTQPAVSTFSMGHSETSDLQKAFPGSPINKGELTDEVVRKVFVEGDIDAQGNMNDFGYAWGTVNVQYAEAPKLTEVEVGGGGLPGSPYAPNIASPEAVDRPDTIPASGVEVTNNERGVGGSPYPGDALTSPSTTSAQLNTKKIVNFELGKRISL